MPRIGLALSGGGFRATLYHLGVVRFLRDSGALQNVTDIASVSGGSILAAHMVSNWDRYNGGDDDNRSFQHIPGTMASIPQAVGASSAFPGLFPPVEVRAADLGVRNGQFPTEFFTDGGVYDNLGLRAFSWLKQREVSFDQILVSDAGKPFQILSDASLGFIGQSMRATDILWDRGRIILQVPISMKNLEFRQPNEELRGTITRIAEPMRVEGQERTVYEFEYDLSQLPPEEPVTIEVELIGEVPKTVRAPFPSEV